MTTSTADPAALSRVAERVESLAATYEPPSFSHVPNPDAALFLCALDHRTGYRSRYLIGGRGPFEGSALMWAVGLRAAERDHGLLTAARLCEIGGKEMAELFRIGGETVADPDRRAGLWRDLATGLARDHGGEVEALLMSAGGRLGGGGGLVALISRYEAFGDPLQKKSFLFAKIAERRGWFGVSDPDCWEVSADNVLMRLALRSGLVHPGALGQVRAATRHAFKRVAVDAGISPTVLDDLLWELGRSDPDLLGTDGGDLHEPERDPDSPWY